MHSKKYGQNPSSVAAIIEDIHFVHGFKKSSFPETTQIKAKLDAAKHPTAMICGKGAMLVK